MFIQSNVMAAKVSIAIKTQLQNPLYMTAAQLHYLKRAEYDSCALKVDLRSRNLSLYTEP